MTIQVMENGVVRDATPEEVEEIEARRVAAAGPALAEQVPMLNLKLALAQRGKLAQLDGLIAGIPEDQGGDRARAFYTSAQNARRDNYLVNLFWPVLFDGDEDAFNEAWQHAATLDPDAPPEG